MESNLYKSIASILNLQFITVHNCTVVIQKKYPQKILTEVVGIKGHDVYNVNSDCSERKMRKREERGAKGESSAIKC